MASRSFKVSKALWNPLAFSHGGTGLCGSVRVSYFASQSPDTVLIFGRRVHSSFFNIHICGEKKVPIEGCHCDLKEGRVLLEGDTDWSLQRQREQHSHKSQLNCKGTELLYFESRYCITSDKMHVEIKCFSCVQMGHFRYYSGQLFTNQRQFS